MNTTRITVLSRHAILAANILKNSVLKSRKKSLVKGVDIVIFECDSNSHLFGMPYSMETLTKENNITSKMLCHINESGKARYIPNRIHTHFSWVVQENIFCCIKNGYVQYRQKNEASTKKVEVEA